LLPMGKARGTLLAVLAALLTGVGIGPMADTAQGLFITHSAGCSPDGSRYSRTTRNVHLCRRDDLIWAVLQSDPELKYELCVKFGAHPISCDAAVGDHSTTPYLIITKHFLGTVTVSWRFGGAKVGSYTMQFVEYPAVPPFEVSPLIVSGTHRLFGLVVRHVPTGLRVSAWGECRNGCRLPLELVSAKGYTRRYRVTGSRRNSLFSLGDRLGVSVDAPGRRVQGTELWSRLYTGVLVRDRSGGPNDTAIRRLGPPLCNPPGLPFGFGRRCWKVSWPEGRPSTAAGPRTTRRAS
jgi:hypothetical protein